jgi:hypothetical protein
MSWQVLSTFSNPCFGAKIDHNYGHWRDKFGELKYSDEDN